MSAPAIATRPSPLQAIRALSQVFARQGTLVPSWRSYNGRKLGPYYRLAYRLDGRQLSIYLGKSPNLLRQVRRLLDQLQNFSKTRRILRHTQNVLQKAARQQQAQFKADLKAVGLQLRGYAVRGWRRYNALFKPPRQSNNLLRKLSVRLRINFLACTAALPPLQLRNPPFQIARQT